VRSVPDPLMDCLDCADASQNVPVRNETITALQALAMMNNPFLIQQSRYLAERLWQKNTNSNDRLVELCRLTWGRSPSARERHLLADYSEKHGPANVCRLVLNSNEFVFVD
jgi:hypothetical protein